MTLHNKQQIIFQILDTINIASASGEKTPWGHVAGLTLDLSSFKAKNMLLTLLFCMNIVCCSISAVFDTCRSIFKGAQAGRLSRFAPASMSAYVLLKICLIICGRLTASRVFCWEYNCTVNLVCSKYHFEISSRVLPSRALVCSRLHLHLFDYSSVRHFSRLVFLG